MPKRTRRHSTARDFPRTARLNRLYQEILGRIKETDLSVPFKRAGYWYYTKTEAGKQYRVHARRKGSMAAPEQVVLDENALAAGHAYFDVGRREVSPDGRLLAFTVDTTGAERFVLRVKDLTTGRLLPDRIEGVEKTMAKNFQDVERGVGRVEGALEQIASRLNSK